MDKEDAIEKLTDCFEDEPWWFGARETDNGIEVIVNSKGVNLPSKFGGFSLKQKLFTGGAAEELKIMIESGNWPLSFYSDDIANVHLSKTSIQEKEIQVLLVEIKYSEQELDDEDGIMYKGYPVVYLPRK
jgi:hypothetical protein